jgi:hypothetical protein
MRMHATNRILPASYAITCGRLHALVLIDLPVDLVIFLEQQERANQTQPSEKAPSQRWCV